MMSEIMNTKMKKQNQKQIHKMKKYISTFPLKPEEILLIHKDIEGMAEEALERGESLDKVLGKSPREFCDELMYAVGGIKTPGGRKLLRFAGAYYEIVGVVYLFSAGINLGIAVSLGISSFFGENITAEFWLDLLASVAVQLFFGSLYYVSGKKAIRYSSDVSKTIYADYWGIGVLLLGIVDQLISIKYGIDTSALSAEMQQILNYSNVISLTLWICASAAYILGAIRNRPHNEA